MLIAWGNLKEIGIERMNGGEGFVFAKMFADDNGKIMLSRLPQGASIGLHRHTDSSEVNYVVSGRGEACCDGQTEPLEAGLCHYCPKGASHSIRNTGQEELVLFTVVSKQ